MLPYPEMGPGYLPVPEPGVNPSQLYPSTQNAPFPTTQNYPPTQNAPYPPTQNTPYPPTQNTPYPISQNASHPPTQNTPYPPTQNTPYPPTQNAPYPPTQNAPYPPTQNAPYPPTQNTYYPTPQNSPYPPTQNAPYHLTNNTSYPPNNNTPYPPTQNAPYPPTQNTPYPYYQFNTPYSTPQNVAPFDQEFNPITTSVQAYPPSAPYVPVSASYAPPVPQFNEGVTSPEDKEGLLSGLSKLTLHPGSDDLKRMGKDVLKMFQERFIPTQRSSHHFRYAPESHENTPQSPARPEFPRNPQTFNLNYEVLKFQPFLKQNYSEISKDCTKRGNLFQDPLFDPRLIELSEGSGAHYGYRGGYRKNEIQWLRPREISQNPKMFVDGTARFDINQGEIGDCWFLAALANLAEDKACFDRVVPGEQDFGRKYCGIFRFRFYRFGEWVEVVIDDRLPTRNGKLIYLKSRNADEFWSPLLEKAYAKLYGSYKALEGGLTVEAAVDFTGGIPEMIDLTRLGSGEDKLLFDYLKKSDSNNAFLSCSLSNSRNQREAQGKGLQSRHAYTITKVVDVRGRGISESIPLIRLRNPHGNHKEWTGDWSDGDRFWNQIDRKTREKLDLQFNQDGEFYMNFNRDFMKYFGEIEIVHQTPSDVGDMKGEQGNKNRKYNMIHFQGSWSRRAGTAGGCGNDTIASFAENPQFIFSITDPRDKSYNQECPVVMSLAQKVEKRKSEHAIGFRIYKLSPGMEKADARFLTYNRHVAKSEQYINLREISIRVNLPEGEYVVIPSTFNRGEEGEFLLRLYFDQKWGAKSTSGVQSSVPDRPAPRVPGVPAGTPRREEGGYVGGGGGYGGGGGAGYSPFARGVGGRASRVINIPIQILSDRPEKTGLRKQLINTALDQLMKSQTFRSLKEKLEFLYKWKKDPESEVSLLRSIVSSFKNT